MNRIAADLRDHYWYDELVHELLDEIERYLAFLAAVGGSLRDPAS